MNDITVRAIGFVLIIGAGYLCKKTGLLPKAAYPCVSRMVLYLTLPAAIILSFQNFQKSASLAVAAVLGFAMNGIMVGIGYLSALKKSREERAFSMLNYSGYSIGTFTLPYLQNIFGNSGCVLACLFDVGNAFMNTGTTYVLASAVVGREKKMSPAVILRQLFSSVPFDIYVVMTSISLLNMRLPGPVLQILKIPADANAFLAMFLIGLGFEVSARREYLLFAVKNLCIRFLVVTVAALLVYNLLPFPLVIRQMLVLILYSPYGILAVIFTEKLGLDRERSCFINSMCIVLSLCIITILLNVWNFAV